MPDNTFVFLAKCFEDKEAWIGAIGKAMIKSTKSAKVVIDEEQ